MRSWTATCACPTPSATTASAWSAACSTATCHSALISTACWRMRGARRRGQERHRHDTDSIPWPSWRVDSRNSYRSQLATETTGRRLSLSLSFPCPHFFLHFLPFPIFRHPSIHGENVRPMSCPARPAYDNVTRGMLHRDAFAIIPCVILSVDRRHSHKNNTRGRQETVDLQ